MEFIFNDINMKDNQKNEILEEKRQGINLIGKPVRRYATIDSRSIINPRYFSELMSKVSFPFKRKWTEDNEQKTCFSTK